MDGHAELATAFISSGNYYRMLGVNARIGRTLLPEDDQPGAPPAAVISSKYWHARFGTDPAAVGKTVKMNNVMVTIVGVTPAGFYVSPVWRRVDVILAMEPPILSSTPIGARDEDEGRCQPILRLRAGMPGIVSALSQREIAIMLAGGPVPARTCASVPVSWHGEPDGGSCFADPAGGGWVYVSNSELNGRNGGAEDETGRDTGHVLFLLVD